MPVYLYTSPITEAFFKANGANYGTFLVRWRDYLRNYPNFQQVNRRELLAGLKPGVLVLGSAVLLDEQERAAIEKFADGGGNMMVTWGSGARDGKGGWSGFGFLEKLMDVKVRGFLDRQSNEWFLNPFGDGPLTYTVPAGKRIYLGRTAEAPLRLEAAHLAGRYFEWGRHPGPNNDTGAIAYTEKAGSRRILLGFSEVSWEFDQENDLLPILDASFAWLRHQVRIYPATWPEGYVAAHLLEMDTEDKFSSAEYFAQDLEKVGMRGSFYCVSSIAKNHKKLINQLLEKHEIGFHGDVHVGFKGKPAAQQEQRISAMQKDMQATLEAGRSLKRPGFRAPTESYDAETERILRQHGFGYHVSQPEQTEARLPFFSRAEDNLSTEQALVVLPRTQNDDLNYTRLKKQPEQIKQQMMRELDYVLEMGALGLLSVHSQSYVTGGWFNETGFMRKAVPAYLQRLQQNKDKIWIATGHEIANWWRARARITHSPSNAADQLQFQVAAPGVAQRSGFFITRPVKNKALPRIEALQANLPLPKMIAIDEFRLALIFEPLAAGTYSYRVKFAE
jgi:peptidoglycan/xylan/chitin deacetylase (PgdA/CDA1 family)